MSGVGLPTVGKMLGHRKHRTTALYAHLDDAVLRDAAAQTALVIAGAMRYNEEPQSHDASKDGHDNPPNLTPLPNHTPNNPARDTLPRERSGHLERSVSAL